MVNPFAEIVTLPNRKLGREIERRSDKEDFEDEHKSRR